MNAELIDALRGRTASACIGPSTARKMGPKGTVAAARKYLRTLPLGDFRCNSARDFQAALDIATSAFVKHLPNGAQHWGAARKFVNIFLRDVVYNRFLSDWYELSDIVRLLEVPLDSHVASGLREEPGGESLPRWKTIIGLDESKNRVYQSFAQEVAARRNCARVHLDLLYWRRELVVRKTMTTEPAVG